MGTNYYLHQPKCECCNRRENQLHIGKSSCGWTFSFRGYSEGEGGLNIRSYKEWLKFLEIVLEKPGYEIQDEYGNKVTLEEFSSFVDMKRKEPRNHALMFLHYGNEWVDEEGHSFSGGEFS